MWVKIRVPEGPKFSIPIPLSMLGVAIRIAARADEKMAQCLPYAKDMSRDLRDYISRNGHFTMVDVESSDGTVIKITV